MKKDPFPFMIHNCPTIYQDQPPGTLITINHADTSGTMWIIPLFEGIYLSINDFNMYQIPVLPSEHINHMLINYCIEGRCEVNLGEDGFIFVDQEFLSIDTHTAQQDFTSPTGRYQGLELFFDFDSISGCYPEILTQLGINLWQIRNKFCPDNISFLAKAPESVIDIFTELAGQTGALTLMRLSVLKLLYELSVLDRQAIPEKRLFLTRSQTAIAKRTCEIITTNPSQKHSVAKIAAHFGISETSLRNYFKQVYGESIPSLLRRRRMDQAAADLCNTAKSITEIAMEAGYENQSKFSAAFKRYYRETPMEYRRMKLLDRKGEHVYD